MDKYERVSKLKNSINIINKFKDVNDMTITKICNALNDIYNIKNKNIVRYLGPDISANNFTVFDFINKDFDTVVSNAMRDGSDSVAWLYSIELTAAVNELDFDRFSKRINDAFNKNIISGSNVVIKSFLSDNYTESLIFLLYAVNSFPNLKLNGIVDYIYGHELKLDDIFSNMKNKYVLEYLKHRRIASKKYKYITNSLPRLSYSLPAIEASHPITVENIIYQGHIPNAYCKEYFIKELKEFLLSKYIRATKELEYELKNISNIPEIELSDVLDGLPEFFTTTALKSII